MKNNLILTGFMGSGKTAVSQVLAAKTGWKYISVDDLIVKKEGRPIVDIFRDAGESYFREVEKAVLQEICFRTDQIIDCGGGVILDEENRAVMKSGGTVFFLSASEEEIYRRVKGQTHRPLLNTPDPVARIRELLAWRLPLYHQADVTIDTDGKTTEMVADEILTHAPQESV